MGAISRQVCNRLLQKQQALHGYKPYPTLS